MSPILLGVRHHGPGSARAVRRVLSAYQPDIVLIEGPPEADGLAELAADDDMRAPVALLGYPTPPKTAAAPRPDPRGLRASFWPFAEFSPEWQALRWAVSREVPARFVDLPVAVRFAVGDPPARRAGDGVRADPIGSLELKFDDLVGKLCQFAYRTIAGQRHRERGRVVTVELGYNRRLRV